MLTTRVEVNQHPLSTHSNFPLLRSLLTNLLFSADIDLIVRMADSISLQPNHGHTQLPHTPSEVVTIRIVRCFTYLTEETLNDLYIAAQNEGALLFSKLFLEHLRESRHPSDP